MKAAVTGANGFIGSKLCEALLERGDRITCLVRPTSNIEFIENIHGIEIIQGDITEKADLENAFSGSDVVFHTAAYASDWGPWETFRKVNVEGTRNVMEAALSCGVRRVVHTSSVSVYGFPGGTEIKEDHPFVDRHDPYCTTKAEGEDVALRYNERGLEVTAIRPAGVFGPHDRTTTAVLAPELEKGGVPFVSKGRYYMAPLYIDNLVQAMLLAAESENAPGEAFNIADDDKITWKQYMDWMCEELECKPQKLSFPKWLAWPVATLIEWIAKLFNKKTAPNITRYRVRVVMNDAHYSTEKAKRLLGYRPHIGTREGIKHTIAWFRGYQKNQTA